MESLQEYDYLYPQQFFNKPQSAQRIREGAQRRSLFVMPRSLRFLFAIMAICAFTPPAIAKIKTFKM
jgi:hypothetical protein